jgi:hypothetical protein
MHKCAGIKPNGGRCERIVSSEQTYCYSHDPGRQAERQRNAARGGKAKASSAGELRGAKDGALDVIDGVLSGRIERGVGSVAFQGYNTLANLVRTEMKVREIEELAREVEEIREVLERSKANGA